MGWPRLGQVEVDAIVQLGDGLTSADLLDQVGLLIVRNQILLTQMPDHQRSRTTEKNKVRIQSIQRRPCHNP
jgi:hypothetical protein